MRNPSAAALMLLGTVLCCGCAHGRNYDAPWGPTYLGGVAPERSLHRDLRVVSFNVDFARTPYGVVEVLRETPTLRGADLVLLQETDLASTRWMANALGRSYLYVPSMRWHPASRQDYGNAILSAWPIVGSAKILLPHLGRWRRSRRVAAAATICVGSTSIRVYATHLGTAAEIGPGSRREQLNTVLEDADDFTVVIVGGDFNSGGVAEAAVERGYAWPTRGRGSTKRLWALDHVLVRGAVALDAGVAPAATGVSDHRPVWAAIRLDPTHPSTSCAPS